MIEMAKDLLSDWELFKYAPLAFCGLTMIVAFLRSFTTIIQLLCVRRIAENIHNQPAV